MSRTEAPLAITMGDPNGVGPEIVLRAWSAGDLGDDVVVYGDAAVLRHGAARSEEHTSELQSH